jgi:hypothetical protein
VADGLEFNAVREAATWTLGFAEGVALAGPAAGWVDARLEATATTVDQTIVASASGVPAGSTVCAGVGTSGVGDGEAGTGVGRAHPPIRTVSINTPSH